MHDTESDIAASLVSDPSWRRRILLEFGERIPIESLAWSLPDGYDVPAVRGPLDVPSGRAPIPMRSGGAAWTVREDVGEIGAIEQASRFGADCVGLVIRDIRSESIAELVRSIAGERMIRHLVGGSAGLDVIDGLVADHALPPNGSLDMDPAAERGPQETSKILYDRVAAMMPSALDAGFRPACANGLVAHLGGATDTTELMVILASLAAWLGELVDRRGLSPDDAADLLHVTTSAGPLFFPVVARLRSLRLGLFRVAGAYGVSPDAIRRIPVHAVTSPRFQSVFDPWSNLLRATTAAAAAVIGGCDSLTVTPHDHPTMRSVKGRRLALALHAMLRDEARLHLVADPACGSWYIETLTDRMGESAWGRFQEIEADGGLLKTVRDGDLAARIQTEARAQEDAIDKRERVMIGVNRYADPAEPPPSGLRSTAWARPSARLEGLRAAMHPESNRGHAHPPALLLVFGDGRVCRQRAAFTTDFFGCAGIRVEGPVQIETVESMVSAVRDSESPIIVLCGPDETYERYVKAARQGLAERPDGATLVGIGCPPDDNPSRWGLDSCLREHTSLVGGLGMILTAAGLHFASER